MDTKRVKELKQEIATLQQECDELKKKTRELYKAKQLLQQELAEEACPYKRGERLQNEKGEIYEVEEIKPNPDNMNKGVYVVGGGKIDPETNERMPFSYTTMIIGPNKRSECRWTRVMTATTQQIKK